MKACKRADLHLDIRIIQLQSYTFKFKLANGQLGEACVVVFAIVTGTN